MGKQICFFATAKDYFMLFDHIINNGWYLVDDYGESISLEQAKQMVQNHYDNNGLFLQIFATSKNLAFVKNIGPHREFVDTLLSDVIEVIVCSPPPPNIRGLIILPNQYEHGRIWYERQYYDCDGKTVTKSAEVDKMYNSLVRKIRTKAVISKDKFAYILPDAYRLYKENRYIPCSGKHKIVFD